MEGWRDGGSLHAMLLRVRCNTCDRCFSRSFTSLSTIFCLLLVSSCSRFSSSSLLRRSSSRACRRISISRSCTRPHGVNAHVCVCVFRQEVVCGGYPMLQEALLLHLGLSEEALHLLDLRHVGGAGADGEGEHTRSQVRRRRHGEEIPPDCHELKHHNIQLDNQQ